MCGLPHGHSIVFLSLVFTAVHFARLFLPYLDCSCICWCQHVLQMLVLCLLYYCSGLQYVWPVTTILHLLDWCQHLLHIPTWHVLYYLGLVYSLLMSAFAAQHYVAWFVLYHPPVLRVYAPLCSCTITVCIYTLYTMSPCYCTCCTF